MCRRVIMTNKANNEKHSQEYTYIINEIVSKWQDWKITVYNVNFATSTHSKKIKANNKI